MGAPSFRPLRMILAIALAGLVASELSAQEAWQSERKDLHVPMRDGRWLAADLYLPNHEGRSPTILIQTPYKKERMGAPMAGVESSRRRAADGLFDREHYAYLVVDWRGFYGSRQALTGSRKVDRGPDGYDCVEWIAKQPWSDGKVGSWGPSALGKQQFETAVEQPPHLVCCVPLIAAMGQSYDAYYQGGVMLEGHVDALDRLGFGVGALVKAAPKPDQLIWKSVERQSFTPEKVQVPCLLVTGWWDNFPDAILRTFEALKTRAGPAARQHSKLIIGPWDHVSVDDQEQGCLKFPGARDAAREAAMAFFDFWLRDKKDNGWDRQPVVRYFQVGDQDGRDGGAWHAADRFPGVKTEKTIWWLHEDGRIDRDQPSKASKDQPRTRELSAHPQKPVPTLGGANLPPLKHGPTDHRQLLTRDDLLSYQSVALKEALRITGVITLHATIGADRPDVDLAAWLLDLHPDGEAALIADGIQRAKFAGGGERLLKAGEPRELTVTFPVIGFTIAKEHRLGVLLATSNSPRYERNTHGGDDHYAKDKARDVTLAVFHDQDHPLRLVLPIRTD